jgi:membrane protein implicated in regulation of membrane protease activity
MDRRWTSRAARRYLAFQVPGCILLVAGLLLARRWIELPAWVFWGAIAAWVVKDVVLFPFVWRAYEPQEGRHPMLGARGVAEGTLAPSGYVRVGAELWKATVPDGGPAIGRGEPVRVREIRGLTLIVGPEAEDPRDGEP